MEEFKAKVFNEYVEVRAIHPQRTAPLVEPSKVFVNRRNALDPRDAAAQRPCRTAVSAMPRPRTSGENAMKRAFITGGTGFYSMNRARQVLGWKPRVPSREGAKPTFDWFTKRTVGLS